MVKSYLKYEHSKTFGLIASSNANAIWIPSRDALQESARSTGSGVAVVGAGEEVFCWDIKRGEQTSRWKDFACKAAVSVIKSSPVEPDVYAVGYSDGSIRIWDSRTATVVIRFDGHKSAVTTLSFDPSGVRLASGSRDTDIIIWDLVAETGLFKLRGHKDQITGLSFLNLANSVDSGAANEAISDRNEQDDASGETLYLISTSKEALVKLWDIESRFCVETHVTQANGECWSLGVSDDQSGFITAGNEGELKFWTINATVLRAIDDISTSARNGTVLTERGSLYRHGKDRTTGVSFHPKLDFLAAHGSDKAVEIWRIRSEGEVQKVMARKRKRRREKQGTNLTSDSIMDGDREDENTEPVDIKDLIIPYVIIRTGGRVRSVDWVKPKSKRLLTIMVAEINNQLEIWNVPVKTKAKVSATADVPEYDLSLAVAGPGHRTDIRALALSSDDRMLLSASNGALKIWNVKTQNCIRTLDCGYALCAAFLPGDKIVVVGNRNGELELFDISSSTKLETIRAHEGPVWAMDVHPDGKSMITGSADKSAKQFNFEILQEEIPGTMRQTPRFHLKHTRTLQVSDDILSVRYSPDSRLIAVALLDNTVKVFYSDTFKLFLNLYGHKLPVLNMDISYDSKLIVTCSADKNVRIWGLDFGDCHKAMFAHQDSILKVAFIPHSQDGNGHNFFSASKDSLVKYWDGDKFEQIQKLDGHQGEIWAMAVSRTGDFVASASHDKSIRIWNQTDEQIFLEEEREKELEELHDSILNDTMNRDSDAEDEEKEAVSASKQTTETLMAGEKIMEALELGMEDLEVMREYAYEIANGSKMAQPIRNPVYLANKNVSAEQYLLNVCQKIQAAALQDALLVLPFSKVPALFTFLQIWAERQWNMPLTCRMLFFMLKSHYKQIVASKNMRILMDGIREELRTALEKRKDEMGFNLAALRFVGQKIQDMGLSTYVDEAAFDDEEQLGKGKMKRGFIELA